MKNFITRLFTKKKKYDFSVKKDDFPKDGKQDNFPKISAGFRMEGITYETETNSLYIDSTHIGGRKLYVDCIDKWKGGEKITGHEKEVIFAQVIEFINTKGSTKPIVVINADMDRGFWESLCDKYKDRINQIEYGSNEKKGNVLYNIYLKSVQNNGTIVVEGKTIKTETELKE